MMMMRQWWWDSDADEADNDDDDDHDEIVRREAMIVRGVHESVEPPPLLFCQRINEWIPLVWRAKLMEEESWEIQLLEIRLDTD